MKMASNSPATLICSACGKPQDEVRKLIVGVGVDHKGGKHECRLCNDCIGTFMLVMATEDREWFDKQVEEVRAFTQRPSP